MKIIDLNERVQAFRAIHDEKEDGEFTIKYVPVGWRWARIKPLAFTEKEAFEPLNTNECRYEIVMRKKDTPHTGHACISRLLWNHKLLDIYTPWLEKCCKYYVMGLATTKKYGEQ